MIAIMGKSLCILQPPLSGTYELGAQYTLSKTRPKDFYDSGCDCDWSPLAKGLSSVEDSWVCASSSLASQQDLSSCHTP